MSVDMRSFNSPCGFTTHLKDYLMNVVHKLKVRNVWQYLEPSVRGWLDLACKLKGIKFRSEMVLSVLCKILNRVKLLLDFPGLIAAIGVRYAWRASQLAASWGNKSAEEWRNDKAFSFYCGLMALQTYRMFPGIDIPELHTLQNLIHNRGFGRILRFFRKIF